MNNFISIVNDNFYLVIYTDETSIKYINTNGNNNIKLIIKPLEKFFNYQYKEYWIKNHSKNYLLNNQSCWELNMLWSEKVWFVHETYHNQYFKTQYYGWCDIGYFRNRPDDLPIKFLSNWGNENNIINKQHKIIYALINNDNNYLKYLFKLINAKNTFKLPIQPIPPNQTTIAGGFYLINEENIDWWSETYDAKLKLYFTNDYLVKDDQMILVDCIFSDLDKFLLLREPNKHFDNWFMFQRILN
jgi:hypothetical protein